MDQLKELILKIEQLTNTDGTYAAIEKDLLLQYTRNLYEHILSIQPRVESSNATIPAELLPKAQEAEEPSIQLTEIEETELPTEVTAVEQVEEEHQESKTENIEEEQVVEESEKINTEPEEEYDEHDLPGEISTFELEPELVQEEANSGSYFTNFKVWNKDIRSYIGINDKYNFISELFRNNAEAYEEILNELNQCGNKTEALQFLENSGITTLYGWKEDGFSEQIFYNVLSQFFASR